MKLQDVMARGLRYCLGYAIGSALEYFRKRIKMWVLKDVATRWLTMVLFIPGLLVLSAAFLFIPTQDILLSVKRYASVIENEKNS